MIDFAADRRCDRRCRAAPRESRGHSPPHPRPPRTRSRRCSRGARWSARPAAASRPSSSRASSWPPGNRYRRAVAASPAGGRSTAAASSLVRDEPMVQVASAGLRAAPGQGVAHTSAGRRSPAGSPSRPRRAAAGRSDSVSRADEGRGVDLAPEDASGRGGRRGGTCASTSLTAGCGPSKTDPASRVRPGGLRTRMR